LKSALAYYNLYVRFQSIFTDNFEPWNPYGYLKIIFCTYTRQSLNQLNGFVRHNISLTCLSISTFNRGLFGIISVDTLGVISIYTKGILKK